MKDVTVEKAESLVDQIQEVREGQGGRLQRKLLGTGGTVALPFFTNWTLPCELEAAFGSQMR